MRGTQWMTRWLLVLALGLGLGLGTPALAAELTVADYNEITQLYARYNTAIDKGDAEGWADTFTADGSFMNFKGRDALAGFVKNWSSNPQMNGAAKRHFAADLVIVPAAEGAHATVSALLLDLATKPISIQSFISYSDVLVKTQQGWRFKSRALTIPTAAPAKPGS